MAIFRFDPVADTLKDARWEASKICEAFWVEAKSENDAREFAAVLLINFVERRSGYPTASSPWLDPKFAECTQDNPSVTVPPGIIVTLGGRSHS